MSEEAGFGTLQKIGLALVALPLLVPVALAVEDAEGAADFLKIALVVGFLGLGVLWRFCHRWLSTRQEGLLSMVVGVAFVVVMYVHEPVGSLAMDGEAGLALLAIFLYGLVHLIRA